LAVLAATAPARADGAAIPQFWDVKERLIKPDISSFSRVRFLTTTDFPPFNFVDGNGLLSGLHVELARAICRELQILDRCQIQALPWEELEGAIERNEGDALIAGLAVTPEKRERYAFTRAYMRFPARFVTGPNGALEEPIYRNVAGRRVGVFSGSEHEAMLRDYFPEARPVTYSRMDWIFEDLRAGKIDAVFGDGMRLSFWLDGEESEQCCRFAGGPAVLAAIEEERGMRAGEETADGSFTLEVATDVGAGALSPADGRCPRAGESIRGADVRDDRLRRHVRDCLGLHVRARRLATGRLSQDR
jgi:polar amino acid transport system substrate-binding protein